MDTSDNKHCKIEFYFTREKIEKLLKENPHAKGIIIRQEIKVRQTSEKEILNITEITAHADNGEMKSKSLSKGVEGCPNPPGCGTR